MDQELQDLINQIMALPENRVVDETSEKILEIMQENMEVTRFDEFTEEQLLRVITVIRSELNDYRRHKLGLVNKVRNLPAIIPRSSEVSFI